MQLFSNIFVDGPSLLGVEPIGRVLVQFEGLTFRKGTECKLALTFIYQDALPMHLSTFDSPKVKVTVLVVLLAENLQLALRVEASLNDSELVLELTADISS